MIFYENVTFWVAITVAIIAIIIIAKTAVVVPQQNAYVVESLGKYSRTLRAGFHILVPFFERAAYKHSLKELAFDIPEQICIFTVAVALAMKPARLAKPSSWIRI